MRSMLDDLFQNLQYADFIRFLVKWERGPWRKYVDFNVGESCTCYDCHRRWKVGRCAMIVKHGTINSEWHRMFDVIVDPSEWDKHGNCPSCGIRDEWTPEGMGLCVCACGARWGT